MSGEDPLRACIAGGITPEAAIARLLLAGDDAVAIRRRVRAARGPGQAWDELARLAADQPALDRVRQMLDAAAVQHGRVATPAEIAAMFDRAVAIAPEASVAIYSLGDPAKLAGATDEIVAWLRDRHLLSRNTEVLDLGCGIGRIAAAIAPSVRSVLGVDVSCGMLAEARRRCAVLPNVSFVATTGQDLAAIAEATFDLVLAVDSFPYLTQAGVAERHVAESRRVLRPSGALVALNLSYRNDFAADCEDAGRWARQHGFSSLHVAKSPFRSWDAAVTVFGGLDVAARSNTGQP